MTVIERRAKMGKNGQKRKNEKKRKEERKTKQKTSCMRTGRRPSPEGTRLLSAGTISPTLCLGDGPTEGRHDKTRRKKRKKNEKKKKRKEKKRAATQSSKNQTSISMSSWWGKDDTRDPREGREKGAKIKQQS